MLSTPASNIPSENIVLLVGLLLLLVLCGICHGAKTAFFTLNAKDFNYLKVRRTDGARQVVKLLNQPRLLFSTLLVSTTFFNIVIATTAHTLLIDWMPKGMERWLALLFELIIIGLLLLFNGVVIPKIYAAQHPVKMAIFSAPIINIIQKIFSPISKMFATSSNFLDERLTIEADHVMSYNELEKAIEDTVGQKAKQEEVRLLRGIIRFGSIIARQVMTTRMNMVGLDAEKSFNDVLEKVKRSGFSRLPVYKKNFDNIIGILHTKDLNVHINEGIDFDWLSLIRAPLFVPETKSVEDLLKEFQEKRMHIAIVVDEFGGTSGLVTFEDIVEEITGDILDENDELEDFFTKISDTEYLVDGRCKINDLCRQLSINISTFDKAKGMSETVGGLVLELIKKVPEVKETVSYLNYHFTIEQIDRLRIQTIRITIS